MYPICLRIRIKKIINSLILMHSFCIFPSYFACWKEQLPVTSESVSFLEAQLNNSQFSKMNIRPIPAFWLFLNIPFVLQCTSYLPVLVTGQWSLPALFCTHEPSVVFPLPCQPRRAVTEGFGGAPGIQLGQCTTMGVIHDKKRQNSSEWNIQWGKQSHL